MSARNACEALAKEFLQRGENLMDADGNKGVVPGRSRSKLHAYAFILF